MIMVTSPLYLHREDGMCVRARVRASRRERRAPAASGATGGHAPPRESISRVAAPTHSPLPVRISSGVSCTPSPLPPASCSALSVVFSRFEVPRPKSLYSFSRVGFGAEHGHACR